MTAVNTSFGRSALSIMMLLAGGCSGSVTKNDAAVLADVPASPEGGSDAYAGDAASADAGAPGADSAVGDAGRADARLADAGDIDAGPGDAGPGDAGPTDAGPTDAGPLRVDNTDLRREALRPGADPRVLFRYRSYVGTRPAWVSPSSTSTLDHSLVGSVDSMDRGGDGFVPLYVTRFNGTNDGYLGATAVAAQSVGFTVQAWFRAATTGGPRTLFSNDDGTDGFSLKIVDGRLTALVRVRDGGARLTHTVSDTADVDTTDWHAATVQARVVGTDLRVHLYLDQRLVAFQTWPVRDGIADSAALPAVGAEAASGALDSDFFSGEIHAVEVRNWPVDHDILVTPVMGDGSTYLGRPAYHDYLSATQDLYRRMEAADRNASGMADVRVRFQTPMSNDNLIPQGLALGPDGRRLFLAFYWGNLSGNNPDRHPSTIVVFDLLREKVGRIYRLLNAGGGPSTVHAGGLGFFVEHLYVPSRQRVTRYRIADSVELVPPVAGRQPAIHEIRPIDSFVTAANGSFLDIDVDGRDLYVGTFSNGGLVPIHRYALTVDGAVENPSTTMSDDSWMLPVTRVQGAVWVGDHFLLSTSWGNGLSHVYRWAPGGSATEVYELPAGLEDLDLGADGTLWSWSESIGYYYQKRTSPWSTLAPWVMGFQYLTP